MQLWQSPFPSQKSSPESPIDQPRVQRRGSSLQVQGKSLIGKNTSDRTPHPVVFKQMACRDSLSNILTILVVTGILGGGVDPTYTVEIANIKPKRLHDSLFDEQGWRIENGLIGGGFRHHLFK